MQINFTEKATNNNLVICLFEEYDSGEQLIFLNKYFNNNLAQILANNDFTGKKNDKFFSFVAEDLNSITIIGCGKEKDFLEKEIYSLGSNILLHAKANKLKELSIIAAVDSAKLAYSFYLKNYSFNKYKSAEKLKNFVKFESLNIVTNKISQELASFNKLKLEADAVNFARNLITEPSNVIYPESMVEIVTQELKELGLNIKTLGENEMADLGMGSLLSVGRGSSKESKLLIIEYFGSENKEDAPLAFVGKGVTFDSGGLSLKPSKSMEQMKYDMAGSAVVIATIKALASRKAKVNAVGVVGLVENMPDGDALRPGDVVKSMSGQTIEVLNTDAEGRLVLADALWYTQATYKPKFMINLATLTGAIVVTFGGEYAGLFSNNDELSEKLYDSGLATDEKVWRLPMSPDYDKDIDSDIADMRNISRSGGGGSITAAQFLKRFVNDTPWAHLDIAGVTWNEKGTALSPKGATGFGVRLLNKFVEVNYG